MIALELKISLKRVKTLLAVKPYNKHRIQVYDSILCGGFCIGFFDFMFKGKNLWDFSNLNLT